MRLRLSIGLVIGLAGCRSTTPASAAPSRDAARAEKKPRCEPACMKDETCVVRKTYVVEEVGSSVEKEFFCFKTADLINHHIIKR